MGVEASTPVILEEVQPKQPGRFMRFLDRLLGSEKKRKDAGISAAQRAEVQEYLMTTHPEELVQHIQVYSDMVQQGADQKFLVSFLEEIAPSKISQLFILLGSLQELERRPTEKTRYALSGWKDFANYHWIKS